MTKRGRGRPRVRKGRRGAFAERLITARKARGLSQDGAARDLGTSRSTIARWEAGLTRPRGIALRAVEAWLKGRA